MPNSSTGSDPAGAGQWPLSGVRVLEMASVLAGPYAGVLLQKLGAEVIKVEVPDGGDPFRAWSGAASPPFAQFNLGKQSIVVNLREEEGPEVIRRLLPEFDVLLENSRPGRMESIGLEPARCLAINPGLVYVSVSGFGDVGPLARRPAYDLIGQAVSGLLGLISPPDGRPLVGPALGDMATGLIGAAGALAGLVSRARSGQGVVVSTSMLEAIVAFIGDAFTQWTSSRVAPSDALRSRQSHLFMFQGSDGRYVALHLSTSQKFFANLCRAVGRVEVASDPRFVTYALRMENYDALVQALEGAFGSRTSAEWEAILIAEDVPCSLVLSLPEVLELPQVEQLELFSDPVDSGLRYLRGPWRFDGLRPPVAGRPPELGEHTESVLESVLDPDELVRLHQKGVIRYASDYQPTADAVAD